MVTRAKFIYARKIHKHFALFQYWKFGTTFLPKKKDALFTSFIMVLQLWSHIP